MTQPPNWNPSPWSPPGDHRQEPPTDETQWWASDPGPETMAHAASPGQPSWAQETGWVNGFGEPVYGTPPPAGGHPTGPGPQTRMGQPPHIGSSIYASGQPANSLGPQPPRKNRTGLLVGALTLVGVLLLSGIAVGVKLVSQSTHGHATASGSSPSPTTQRITAKYATFELPSTANAVRQKDRSVRESIGINLKWAELAGYYDLQKASIYPNMREIELTRSAHSIEELSQSVRRSLTGPQKKIRCNKTVTWTTEPRIIKSGSDKAVHVDYRCTGSTGQPVLGQVNLIYDSRGRLYDLNFCGLASTYNAQKSSINHVISSFRSR